MTLKETLATLTKDELLMAIGMVEAIIMMRDKEAACESPEIVYTVDEAAEAAKCSKSLLYQEIRSGSLTATKLGAKCFRITERDLRKWKNSKRG